VGHKPSGRLVPNTGHFPAADVDVGPFLVTGPLGRRVDDAEAVLRIIAGPDGADPVCHPMAWAETAPADMNEVTVIPMEGNGRTRIRAPMRQAIADCATALSARGARVEERVIPGLRKGFAIWSSMLSDAADAHYDTVLGDGNPINLWRQLLAMPFGLADHAYHALILAGLDVLSSRFARTRTRFVAEGRALQAELEEAMGPRGVILFPPYSRPAPRHHAPWLTPFDPVCTAIFNVMEFPVTVVPVGMSDKGLPICVQVVGCRGNDGLTLAVARALEEDFGGWRRSMAEMA
jgi:fatty acid amide hydrolase 2